MELHVPVICITFSKKILIAKRADNREVLPGLWEFGAAKPNGQETLIDTLKREYLADFNAIIVPISTEFSNMPYPISMYEVEKNGELHKGIVVVAILRNPEALNHSPKHSEIKVATLEEINAIPDEECVPGFKTNANLAFNIVNFE